MKTIPLRDKFATVVAHAIVDDGDFERVSRFRWHKHPQGYAVRTVWFRDGDGRKRCSKIGLHREVLGLGRGDSGEVDHINGDGLDNRRTNLRVVTHQTNVQNRRASTSNRYSSARGVSYFVSRKNQMKPWLGRLQVDGRIVFRQTFKTEAEAVVAVKQARVIHQIPEHGDIYPKRTEELERIVSGQVSLI